MSDVPTSAADLYRQLYGELMKRGAACAVDITGDPDSAWDIDTPEKAWAAIDAALKLGIERNNELNALRMKGGSGGKTTIPDTGESTG